MRCINCGCDVPGVQMFCDKCWQDYRDGLLPPIAKIGQRPTVTEEDIPAWKGYLYAFLMGALFYVMVAILFGR